MNKSLKIIYIMFLNKIRCLIPQWNFFDRPSPEVILSYQIIQNDEIKEWNQFNIKSKVKWYNLFFNPILNYKLYLKIRYEHIFFKYIEFINCNEKNNQEFYNLNKNEILSFTEDFLKEIGVSSNTISEFNIKLSFCNNDLSILGESSSNYQWSQSIPMFKRNES